MRVLGLTAAVLLAGVLGVASGYAAAGVHTRPAKVEHSCTATDRKFIHETRLNMMAVGTAGREYLAGTADAPFALAEVERAVARIKRTKPRDPALSRTRLLMTAMLSEYGIAISEHSEGRDAGAHMYRAYGLANFAHDVLVAAGPELRSRGCDVTGLM